MIDKTGEELGDQDKGRGFKEMLSDEERKAKNKSATRNVDYPNLSLIVAYTGIVQQGKQPGMDDTAKRQER